MSDHSPHANDCRQPAVAGPVQRPVMQHTRGPWLFYTEPQPNGCPIVGARGLMVCMLAHTVNQPEQRDEALANAALIAAAPELLECLRAVDVLFAPHCKDSTQADWLDRTQALLRRLGAA